MKKVTNEKELLKAIKKSKKGEKIIFDEQTILTDEFKVSYGNIEVLKNIPEMMKDEIYRKALRLLVLEFMSEDILNRGKRK